MAKKNIQIVYTVNDAALIKSAATIRANEEAARRADNAITKFGKDAQKAGNDSSKSFMNLGSVWRTLIGIGIISFMTSLAKKTFDLGVKQEQLNIAFSTFLGSAEKAKKLLGELTKFAIITPFSPDQVNNAAKALLSFGVAGKDIIPTLKMLGDVSAGTGKDLTEMAIIFGQIRSTGRLMGQDLLQLINAGFNPLQVISEKTGKSVGELKKEMEKGLITFDMVSDAFKTATSEGGLFFNLMEKQSQSVGGLLSTVSGNIDEILKNVFNATSGPLKEFTQQLVEISEAILQFSKSLDQVDFERQQFEQNLLIDNFKAFASAFKDVTSAANANNKSLDQELERLKARKIAMEGGQEVNIQEYDAIIDRIKQIPLERKVVDEYIKTLKEKDVVAKESILTIDALQEQVKKYNDQIEKANVNDLTQIYDLQKRRDEVKALIETLQNLYDLGEKIKFSPPIETPKAIDEDEVKRRRDESIEDAIDSMMKEVQAETEGQELIQNTQYETYKWRQDLIKKEIEDEEKKQELLNQLRLAAYNYGVSLLTQLLMANVQANNEDLKSQEDSFNKRLELAGNNEQARQDITRQKEEFDKRAEKTRLEREKSAQLKQMAIQNLQNALRALGTPPVPNFAEFGIALGFGLAQIAAAKAIGFKDGVIGLNGPGTGTSDSISARLSKGESVITAKATSRSLNLLEAINSGEIDDRILSKVKVGSNGIVVPFDDSKIVSAVDRLAQRGTYEEGYFTVTRVVKSEKLVQHIKSKFKS